MTWKVNGKGEQMSPYVTEARGTVIKGIICLVM